MFKCKNCGAPLTIEEKYCSYCGSENPYFKQHREDMESYKNEFNKTKTNVYDKAVKAKKSSVSVIIMSILVVLNVFVYFGIANSYRIAQGIQEATIRSNLKVHQEQLDEYELDGNFYEFYRYYENSYLYCIDELDEYRVIVNLASDVYTMVLYLAEAPTLEPDRLDSKLESVAYAIQSFERDKIQEEYDDPKQYSGQHELSIKKLEEKYIQVLKTYAYMDDSEISELSEFSYVDIVIKLKEGLKNATQEN